MLLLLSSTPQLRAPDFVLLVTRRGYMANSSRQYSSIAFTSKNWQRTMNCALSLLIQIVLSVLMSFIICYR